MRVIAGTDASISSSEYERDREAIREAMDEIISSHWFRNSKRCREFLQYAIEEALEGRGGKLTERNIGVLVFGRTPEYDTNDDSVVRTSALEVRKRLAQYYHDLGREAAVRIDMPSGGYAPEFRFAETAPAEGGFAPERGRSAVSDSNRRFRRHVIWIAGILLVGIAAFAVWRLRSSDPLDAFWEPMWKGANSLIVAVGSEPPIPDPRDAQSSKEGPSTLDIVRTDRAGFPDAVVVAEVTSLLGAREKRTEVRRASSLTLDDLRGMPAVFVGNTTWTDRLSVGLRFRVQRDDAAGALKITDWGAPTPWRMNSLTPYAQRSEDWAVISRFRDQRTQQPVLLLCGLGGDGTTAAGEFVSRPDLLKTFIEQAPAGWQRKNFQIVVSVDLIKGSVGPPRVLAAHFW